MKTSLSALRGLMLAIVSGAALSVRLILAAGPEESGPQPKRNPNIGYMGREVPAVHAVPPKGERYQALVPDTLDLAERAKLGIHALTHMVNPEMDYELYFWGDFTKKPPVLAHSSDSGNVQYYFMEALPLLRMITGSQRNLEVDQRWMETALQRIGPDGLAYWPAQGRPWGAGPPAWGEQVIGDATQGQFCVPGTLDRLIGAMTIYWLQDQNPVWESSIERMIARLSELTVPKEDYAFFPRGSFAPGARVWNPSSPPPPMPWNVDATLPGWLIWGLAKYYRLTGYEPARDLAQKLIRYVRDPGSEVFDSEGGLRGFSHIPHHTAPVLGMAEFALATDDRELSEFVFKCYEYIRANADPLVGFFPTGLSPKGDGSYFYPGKVKGFNGPAFAGETCGLADMIAIGLKLAEMGYDDCWDDVDRWIRNQFAEAQMVRSDWIYRMLEELDVEQAPPDSLQVTSDRAAERSVGAFAGWPTSNDFFGLPQYHMIMNCCTGAGNRAIYFAWERILRFEEGTLRVNLLLNRASPWADLDSYIPYEGRVDVKVKKGCNLEVRIPEWVHPEETACSVSGELRKLTYRGRYAQIGQVKPQDLVVLTFPISERTVKTTIGGLPCTLTIKGNDVVAFDPSGKWYPFYQRDRFRGTHAVGGRVRWVVRERFVSDPVIDW